MLQLVRGRWSTAVDLANIRIPISGAQRVWLDHLDCILSVHSRPLWHALGIYLCGPQIGDHYQCTAVQRYCGAA